MFLAENIIVLNSLYDKFGLFFKQEGDMIKIIESQLFVLNNYPEIKEKLKEKYGMTFNKKDHWHINGRCLLNLKLRKIKMKPFQSFKILFRALYNFINRIGEEKLRESIFRLLEKYSQFFTAPASKYHHHDYKYGLLEHTVETLENSLFYYHRYSKENQLNKDLIIAGSILHDFAKINCFEFREDGFIIINDLALLHGHIINGVKIISQEINSDILDDILHVAGSHHRIKEWGSPILPIKLEAWIVHLADDASSKIG